MADQNRNNQTVTWNSGGTTFDFLKVNVTDTASAAASLLQNFQVGGVVKWSVRKDGKFTSAGDGSIAGNVTIGGTLTVTGAITGGSFAGIITGPAVSVDNTLPRFDGTGGNVLQDSGIVVSDVNAVSGVGTLACGTVTVTGNLTASGTITASSDARLKTDVETIDDAFDILRRIRGVRYTRIADGTRNYGVIAQELLKAGASEMVREGEDGMLSVDYGSGFGLIAAAFNRMADTIDQLESRLAALEAI